MRDDGETELVASSTVTAGLSPQHKAAVVLFLERVYGVQDQITFYRLLENGFLPDLRAATTLEEVSQSMALFCQPPCSHVVFITFYVAGLRL